MTFSLTCSMREIMAVTSTYSSVPSIEYKLRSGATMISTFSFRSLGELASIRNNWQILWIPIKVTHLKLSRSWKEMGKILSSVSSLSSPLTFFFPCVSLSYLEFSLIYSFASGFLSSSDHTHSGPFSSFSWWKETFRLLHSMHVRSSDCASSTISGKKFKQRPSSLAFTSLSSSQWLDICSSFKSLKNFQNTFLIMWLPLSRQLSSWLLNME